MQVPELRMSFADRARLSLEITQSLRCGRAFLSETSTLPVLSDCVLVLVHPEHGGELRLPAQIVMANEHGTGLSLTALTAQHLLELDGFASSLPPSAAAVPVQAPAASEQLLVEAVLESASPCAGRAATEVAAAEAQPRSTAAAAAQAGSAAAAAAQAGSAAAAAAQAGSAVGQPSSPPTAAAERSGHAEPSDELQPTAADASAPAPEPAQPVAAEHADLLGEHAEALDFPRSAEEELEYATPGQANVTGTELQVESRQERLRNLSPHEQLKIARRGELADRLAVERMYGKQVWEALLQNPRLTIPEVAKIARKGTVPKPILDVILDNNGWIKADAVRRALLSNPKIGADSVTKLLRITPKHELKLIEKGTAYGAVVREAARRLLKQQG